MPAYTDDEIIYHGESPGTAQTGGIFPDYRDAIAQWTMERSVADRELADGIYLFEFEGGIFSGTFVYNQTSIGQVFRINDNCLAKVLEISTPDERHKVMKVQVISGLVPVAFLLGALAVALVAIAVGWSLKSVVKLSEAVSGTEVVVGPDGKPKIVPKGLLDSLTENIGKLLVMAAVLGGGYLAWKYWLSSRSSSESPTS
jgi:hypothetical protein